VTHKKVFIVGFMASGKTSYGRTLADKLNVPFIDLDQLIEKRMGISIVDFFDLWGERYFRRIEKEMLFEIIYKEDSFVCATGGGTSCQPEIMNWLNRCGKTVWLKTDWNLIIERLQLDQIRPLAIQKSNLDLWKLYKEREPYYQLAQEVIT
jgi:shikimate kinase